MTPPPPSHDEWLHRIHNARRDGNFLHVIDLAEQALKTHPGDLQLIYQQLLGFANARATAEAQRRLTQLTMTGRLDALQDVSLGADFAGLTARILKDQAFDAPDNERQALVSRAAAAYEAAFDRWGTSFLAINAATLRTVAGNIDRATNMARAALRESRTEADEYWRFATEAEALLILGDETGSVRAMRDAIAVAGSSHTHVASTRRQIARLVHQTGRGQAVLAQIPTALVLHWIADPRRTRHVTPAMLAQVIPAADNALGVTAFGAILSAADVVVAEALLSLTDRLQLVLPCQPSACREGLTRNAGPGIADRFDRILARSEIFCVTRDGDPGEVSILRLALLQSRGLAALRAQTLSASPSVLRVGPLQLHLSPYEQDATSVTRLLESWPDLSMGPSIWSARSERAMIFGDITGYSRLSEDLQAAFLETVIGGFADAISSLAEGIDYAETAGDGIYIVASDISKAIDLCHGLHQAVESGKLRAADLPEFLRLRLSAHFGPVFRGVDRVINREKYFGNEVIRTARIEPITPPGQTYVTEQFAAMLYAASHGQFRCEYVGVQPMAKNYGSCRMYSLTTGPTGAAQTGRESLAAAR